MNRQAAGVRAAQNLGAKCPLGLLGQLSTPNPDHRRAIGKVSHLPGFQVYRRVVKLIGGLGEVAIVFIHLEINTNALVFVSPLNGENRTARNIFVNESIRGQVHVNLHFFQFLSFVVLIFYHKGLDLSSPFFNFRQKSYPQLHPTQREKFLRRKSGHFCGTLWDTS